MPWYLVVVNIIAHFIYFMIANDIPYIKVSSPYFIGGISFTCLSHLLYLVHFFVDGNYTFWRFFLNNFFTNWICPLFILASMIMTQVTVLVGDTGNETDHKSLFANVIKKLFGRIAKVFEDHDK